MFGALLVVCCLHLLDLHGVLFLCDLVWLITRGCVFCGGFVVY